jgi:hypothetical protein
LPCRYCTAGQPPDPVTMSPAAPEPPPDPVLAEAPPVPGLARTPQPLHVMVNVSQVSPFGQAQVPV